jgi:hypothetical protein
MGLRRLFRDFTQTLLAHTVELMMLQSVHCGRQKTRKS